MNVAIVYGGTSCEKEVSVITGMQAVNALSDRYRVIPVYVTEEGFFSPRRAGKIKTYLGRAARSRRVVFADGKLYRKTGGILVKYADVDCCLLCTHGGGGENGELQGFFETQGLPYTSVGTEGSAIGMDKELSKLVFASMGLKVAPWLCFDGEVPKEEAVAAAVKAVGLPLCVKPCRQGSSIGVAVCATAEEVGEAVDVARCFDTKIIAEKAFTDFKEVNCACLTKDGETIVSETERPLSWRNFLSYEEKYLKSGGKLSGGGRICPADIGAEQTEKIKLWTKTVYRALGAKGIIRVDFIVDSDGEVYVNEANTIPGSLAAYLFSPLGMSYADAVGAAIEDAVARKKEEKRPEYDSPLLFEYLNASSNACKIGGKII